MRLPEDFFVSPRKLNNSVILLSSHLNRLDLSFKAARQSSWPSPMPGWNARIL